MLVPTASAKDYGTNLTRAMFWVQPGPPVPLLAGDVVVIQPITGHPHGHMAMYNGSLWVSDFKQEHGYYPGPSYRAQRPAAVFYRYAFVLVAPPNVLTKDSPKLA